MSWVIEGFRMVGWAVGALFAGWVIINLLEAAQRWLDRRNQ